MVSSEDHLLRLLRDEKLWRDVEKKFDAESSEGWEDLSESDRIVALLGSSAEVDVDDLIDMGGYINRLSHELTRIFDERVICKLVQPACISAEELASISISQLPGISWKRTDETYRLEEANRRIEGFALAAITTERVGEKRFFLRNWLPERVARPESPWNL